jgi:hypothetical protein
MNDRRILSRRQMLKTMAATGALAAADLAWWEEPLLRPRRAWGAAPRPLPVQRAGAQA